MPFWGMSATVALPSTWLRNCGCCEAACAPTTRIATAALASRPPSSHPLQHSRAPCCAPPAPQVHDALKNRPRALHWYRAALEADPLCFEALEAILGGHFLSGAQERALVDSLARSGRSSTNWLRLQPLTRSARIELLPAVSPLALAFPARALPFAWSVR